MRALPNNTCSTPGGARAPGHRVNVVVRLLGPKKGAKVGPEDQGGFN